MYLTIEKKHLLHHHLLIMPKKSYILQDSACHANLLLLLFWSLLYVETSTNVGSHLLSLVREKQSLLPLLFDIYSTNREQSKAVNSKTFFLQNFFQQLHNWSTFNNIKNFDLFYKIKHESKRFLKVITPIFILWSISFSVHLSNILICFNFFRVDCVTFYFRFQLLWSLIRFIE